MSEDWYLPAKLVRATKLKDGQTSFIEENSRTFVIERFRAPLQGALHAAIVENSATWNLAKDKPAGRILDAVLIISLKHCASSPPGWISPGCRRGGARNFRFRPIGRRSARQRRRTPGFHSQTQSGEGCRMDMSLVNQCRYFEDRGREGV